MRDFIQVKMKRVNAEHENQGKIPHYATPGAAGADLYACLDQELVVRPGERVGIPTGIALEISSPHIVALVFARSGLASKKGLTLSNGVGVIDSDFRGELKVLMVNIGPDEVIVRNGDRIAQIVFTPILKALFVEADALADTERGEGGFGSTGF